MGFCLRTEKSSFWQVSGGDWKAWRRKSRRRGGEERGRGLAQEGGGGEGRGGGDGDNSGGEMADDGSSTSPPKRGKAHHRHLSQSTVCLVEYVTARICLSNTQGFLHAKLFIFL